MSLPACKLYLNLLLSALRKLLKQRLHTEYRFGLYKLQEVGIVAQQ